MIKIFEDFNEIHAICKKYDIENYTINSDGSIDVDGSVDLYERDLTILPIKFNRVSGDFTCARNVLTTLEGCPSYVGSSFYCGNNDLTSLKGCPSYVGGTFYCHVNNLTSLESCPSYVGDFFNCGGNKLTSLKGAPKEIRGYFFYNNNPSLPKPILDNIVNIDYILANQEDYGIWREDGSFNELRFNIMMKDKDI